MTEWGRKMFVTPGVVVDGKLVTTDLVDINLGIRTCSAAWYYEDWEDQEVFVTHDPLGNPVDRRHPWNQHTNPRPQARPRQQVQLGDVAGGGTTARTTSPSTPAAGRSRGCGRRRSPDSSTSATSRPPATACRSTCRRPRSRDRLASSGRSCSGATPSSMGKRAPTSRPTPRHAHCTSRRRRSSRSAQVIRRRGRRSRFLTRASAAVSPRPYAASCHTTW